MAKQQLPFQKLETALEEYAENIKNELQSALECNCTLNQQICDLRNEKNRLEAKLLDVQLKLSKASDENEELRKVVSNYTITLSNGKI
jgi:chromosome segregation ATPase